MIGRRGARLEELEVLYRSRFEVFARVATSVTGDAEQARDAVQEAFATAVRKRRSFRGEGPLEAWVWRIVLNAARSDARRGMPPLAHDEAVSANGLPDDDAELRSRSRVCRSGSAPPSSSATTPISTTRRSARRSESAPEPSPRLSNQAHMALRSRLEEART